MLPFRKCFSRERFYNLNTIDTKNQDEHFVRTPLQQAPLKVDIINPIGKQQRKEIPNTILQHTIYNTIVRTAMTPNLRNVDHVEDLMKDVRITDHVKDIIKDDETARDQNFVDDLMSKEMLKLSVKDRNDIQEEIHGVKCLAVEETPELIEKSLKELTEEINHKIPNAQKRAYLKSLEPVNDNSKNASHSSSNTNGPICVSSSPKVVGNNHSENNHISSHFPSSYIHGRDFRLRFLRCDLFDIQKAARRLVTYLDMLVELFGDYALRRPICLSDFTKEELRHFRKGMIQILPYRDRTGRRILIAFPEEEVSQIPPFVKVSKANALDGFVFDRSRIVNALNS